MNTDILNSVSRTFNKFGLQIRKHSPEILLGVGITGVVASAVMACKATTKLNSILEEAKTEIDAIHNAVEHPEVLPENANYTVEDSKKDLAIVYAKTGKELVKLYGPSVALGALSITSILVSNGILHKRNLAIAAAYTTVDHSFKQYRGRVVDRFGEALDRELKHDIKVHEVEEVTVNEDGSESKSTKTVEVAECISGYAFFFDDGCIGWEKDAELNKFHVIQAQNFFNERLKARGYVFLNEIYEYFGVPVTKAGQHVGWVRNTENNDGDGYIDFGLTDIHNPKTRDFVNGYERVLLIDPNVDGIIDDLI